jgi:hypothetical protein
MAMRTGKIPLVTDSRTSGRRRRLHGLLQRGARRAGLSLYQVRTPLTIGPAWTLIAARRACPYHGRLRAPCLRAERAAASGLRVRRGAGPT